MALEDKIAPIFLEGSLTKKQVCYTMCITDGGTYDC